MRVFLDANVLFTAAHNPKGKAALLITLGAEGLFQLATSAYAREEARRNLERKAPGCLPEFGRLLSKIRLVADNPSIHCPADLAEERCGLSENAVFLICLTIYTMINAYWVRRTGEWRCLTRPRQADLGTVLSTAYYSLFNSSASCRCSSD